MSSSWSERLDRPAAGHDLLQWRPLVAVHGSEQNRPQADHLVIDSRDVRLWGVQGFYRQFDFVPFDDVMAVCNPNRLRD